MNFQVVADDVLKEYAGKGVHRQVLLQLAYLRYLVFCEEERKENCKKWGVPYSPSRCAGEDRENYTSYKREVDLNGDKNLLVMVDMKYTDLHATGVRPFARRKTRMSFGTSFLIHRSGQCDILLREDEIVRKKGW